MQTCSDIKAVELLQIFLYYRRSHPRASPKMNEDNMLESAVANGLPPSSGPRGWGLLVGDISVDKVLAPSSDSEHGSSLTFHHKLKQHGSMLYASYQTLNFFMLVTLLIRILEIFMKNVRGQFNKTG